MLMLQFIKGSWHYGELDAVKAFGGDFQAFPVLEDAVKSDVEFLKGSKLIPEKIKISGWIYEVETGRVRRVA